MRLAATAAPEPERVDAPDAATPSARGSEADSEAAKSATEAAAVAEGIAARPLLWSPRSDFGAPARREGGATRGTGQDVGVVALAPPIEGTGLTLASRPVLYWYLAADSPHPIDFTLVDPDEIAPVVEITLDEAGAAGLHRIDLEALGVELRVGPRYQWFVTVVSDREDRSADVLAGASIERVDEPDLSARLERAEAPEERIRLLAGAGIWYDAFALAQRDADRAPEDPAARARVVSLLEQIDLERVVR